MKKQLTAVALCGVMAFTMAACGNNTAPVVATEGAGTTEGTDGTTGYMPLPTAEEANVVLGDFENLTINLVDDYEVSQDYINYLASNVMSSFGINYQVVDDHDVIADGDYVMVNYTGYLNGEAFQGGAAEDQLLDVTNNCAAGGTTGYIDGFTAGLLGKKVGETVTYDVTFPENYGNEDLNGQTTQFEFVIKGIYKDRTVADLTDELVKENFEENFGVTTVEGFMDYLKAYLVSSATYEYVSDYVMNNSTCEVPDTYLDYVTDLYLNYYATTSFGSLEDMESYCTSQGMTMDDVRTDIKTNIESDIKSEIIFSALAKKMGIEATDDMKTSMISGYLVENGGAYETRDELILEMGLGNQAFGEEYLAISCLNSEVIKQIVANSSIFDADGNQVTQ